MDKTNNVDLRGEMLEEPFEFMMGLAEQRSMLLHPGYSRSGFVRAGKQEGSAANARDGAPYNPLP